MGKQASIFGREDVKGLLMELRHLGIVGKPRVGIERQQLLHAGNGIPCGADHIFHREGQLMRGGDGFESRIDFKISVSS